MSTRNVDNPTWGTPEARTAEAARLTKIISQLSVENACAFMGLPKKDIDFLDDMDVHLLEPTYNVSPAQLTWLRDIRDKLL